MKRKTEWDKVAEKEGRIYCQKEDTWCAFTNMCDGSCLRGECVNIVNLTVKNNERRSVEDG